MTFTVKGIRLKQKFLWLLFPAMLVFAITGQSLWMDEGYTVWFASHKSIASFFSTLLGSRRAPGDPQMLFYLLYMWLWVKVWGTSEVALRAANIPFASLLVGAASWASRRLFRRPNAWVFFCLSPFLWFYMNEARPYVATMAFSAVAIIAELAYLMYPSDYRVLAPWYCLTSLLLAWGSHILGAFLIPSLIVMVVVMTKNELAVRKNVLRDWSPALFSLLPGFVALGTFYLWTSTFGVNMKRGEPGMANLAFVFYEFMGFAGLGPPRNELRENPHFYILAGYFPWLLVGVTATLAVSYALLRTRPHRVPRKLALSLLAGLAIAFMASKIAHFPFVGRHVAVFFPMLLILFMSWKEDSTGLTRSRYLSAAALTALGIAWSISDLRLVLLPQYEKDAYRAASFISVRTALTSGGEILWAADPHTAYYYGLRVANPHPSTEPTADDIYAGVAWPVRGQAIDVANWTDDEATSYMGHRPKPVILVLSRPDLYDKRKGWRALVEKQKPPVVAILSEFQIYEWPARVESEIVRLSSLDQRPAPSFSERRASPKN